MPVARFCNVNLSELGNTTSGKSGPVAKCGRCTGREGETDDPARTGAKLELIHGKCVYCRWVHGVLRSNRAWVVVLACSYCSSPLLLLIIAMFLVVASVFDSCLTLSLIALFPVYHAVSACSGSLSQDYCTDCLNDSTVIPNHHPPNQSTNQSQP